MQETWVPSLGWEDPLEKGKVAHFSILAWRIHGLQSTGSQKVRHDWATFTLQPSGSAHSQAPPTIRPHPHSGPSYQAPLTLRPLLPSGPAHTQVPPLRLHSHSGLSYHQAPPTPRPLLPSGPPTLRSLLSGSTHIQAPPTIRPHPHPGPSEYGILSFIDPSPYS